MKTLLQLLGADFGENLKYRLCHSSWAHTLAQSLIAGFVAPFRRRIAQTLSADFVTALRHRLWFVYFFDIQKYFVVVPGQFPNNLFQDNPITAYLIKTFDQFLIPVFFSI